MSKLIHEKIVLDTSSQTQICSITQEIQNYIEKHNVSSGIVTVRSMHTTASICINENEPGLIKDFELFLTRTVPDTAFYHHDDWTARKPQTDDEYEHENGFAHIRSALLGCDTTLAIKGGKLSLGRWQSIFFVECDGPRKKRTIEVTIQSYDEI